MNNAKIGIEQALRPYASLLSRALIERVIDEAFEILEHVGMRMSIEEGLELLGNSGARVDRHKGHVFITRKMVEAALYSAPAAVNLYDRNGELAVELKDDRVYFFPMASGTDVWDPAMEKIRPAVAKDLVECLKVTNAMKHIAVQSSNYYPSDVPPEVMGYYRNFLALKYGAKPNWGSVPGTLDNVEATLALMTAVRGSEQVLREKPWM
jgi:trimethylamine:corrinoid methyltransferase-like protein